MAKKKETKPTGDEKYGPQWFQLQPERNLIGELAEEFVVAVLKYKDPELGQEEHNFILIASFDGIHHFCFDCGTERFATLTVNWPTDEI